MTDLGTPTKLAARRRRAFAQVAVVLAVLALAPNGYAVERSPARRPAKLRPASRAFTRGERALMSVYYQALRARGAISGGPTRSPLIALSTAADILSEDSSAVGESRRR